MLRIFHALIVHCGAGDVCCVSLCSSIAALVDTCSRSNTFSSSTVVHLVMHSDVASSIWISEAWLHHTLPRGGKKPSSDVKRCNTSEFTARDTAGYRLQSPQG